MSAQCNQSMRHILVRKPGAYSKGEMPLPCRTCRSRKFPVVQPLGAPVGCSGRRSRYTSSKCRAVRCAGETGRCPCASSGPPSAAAREPDSSALVLLGSVSGCQWAATDHRHDETLATSSTASYVCREATKDLSRAKMGMRNADHFGPKPGKIRVTNSTLSDRSHFVATPSHHKPSGSVSPPSRRSRAHHETNSLRTYPSKPP